MKSEPHHLIDKYLRDELTQSELQSFEYDLINNPDFASQVSADQLITNGISELRKAELKSRLNGISVTSGWLGLGQFANSTLIKSIGVFFVGTLALGVYLVRNENLEIENSITKPSALIAADDIIYPSLPAVNGIMVPAVAEVVVKKHINVIANKGNNLVTLDEGEVSIKSSPDIEKTNLAKDKTFDLSVNVPSVGDFQDEKSLSVADATLPEISKDDELGIKETSSIDVETIYKKNSDIRYKYFDGKLYLFGDFKSSPYELLEINGKKTKRLYLFHQNQYFDISISEKVQDLILIENSLQIQELEIIRNNKH